MLLVARGGRGGRGNEAFKSTRNNAPKMSEKGEPGAERWLHIELKLVRSRP
jgi:GTP-binding protein